MVRRQEVETSAPYINIGVALDGPSLSPSSHFFRRGAALLAVIEYFRQREINVKLTGIICCQLGSDHTNGCMISVVVKRPEEAFTVNDVAFTFCHPAILRRIGIATFERTALGRNFVDGAYGVPVSLTNPDYDLYIPPVHKYGNWDSKEAAEQSITDLINHYNQTI